MTASGLNGGGRRLGGRVAVVTGAASGFGRAIARRLSADGARVALVDLAADDAGEAAADDVRSRGGDACYLRADVSNEGRVEAAFAAAAERWGRIDIAVNDAGVLGGGWIHEEGATAHLRRQLDVNVAGVWHGCRAALAHMRPGGGAIVNTGSAAALVATPASPAYGLAKAAVVHLTRSLAAGYGGEGVRVNAVLPGPSPTAVYSAALPWPAELGEHALPALALGRAPTPDDVAAAVAYLCSDEAAYVNGAVLAVGAPPDQSPPGRRR